jgi:putative tributyrin esterase
MSFQTSVSIPETGRRAYPVLWLLHGAGDDQTGWFRNTPIERLAGRRGLAVVAPGAGLSLYEDMAHGQRFFTHIADELPELLPRLLPLSRAREDNFIAGLSMGGMGALKIAIHRPERYAAVGCLSAGYTNYRFHEPEPGSFREKRYFWAYGAEGPGPSEAELLRRCEDIAKGAAAGSARAPRIYHACGTEDSLIRNARLTRDFFEALPGNPFSYAYREYPGRHNWEFWGERLPEMLDFLLEK